MQAPMSPIHLGNNSSVCERDIIYSQASDQRFLALANMHDGKPVTEHFLRYFYQQPADLREST